MPSKDYKRYSVYLYSDDKPLIDYLESHDKPNEFIKTLLEKHQKGLLVDIELEDLQTEKLRADIALKNVTIQIKKQQLLFMQNFGANPSTQATNAIKDGARGISLIDEKNKRFYCPICSEVFNWKNNKLTDCKEAFIDHFYKSHKGDPDENFIVQLGELQ